MRNLLHFISCFVGQARSIQRPNHNTCLFTLNFLLVQGVLSICGENPSTSLNALAPIHISYWTARSAHEVVFVMVWGQNLWTNNGGNMKFSCKAIFVFFIVVGTTFVHAQTRCSPDGFGGQRCTDSYGNTTRLTPDGFGGARIQDSNGNTTRVSPDGFGGNRYSDSNGNMRRQTPDGFGGSRVTDSNGNVTRITPDGFGGSRITDQNGNVTRCSPDGFGGMRCN